MTSSQPSREASAVAVLWRDKPAQVSDEIAGEATRLRDALAWQARLPPQRTPYVEVGMHQERLIVHGGSQLSDGRHPEHCLK